MNYITWNAKASSASTGEANASTLITIGSEKLALCSVLLFLGISASSSSESSVSLLIAIAFAIPPPSEMCLLLLPLGQFGEGLFDHAHAFQIRAGD